jgi:hypothetical protein
LSLMETSLQSNWKWGDQMMTFIWPMELGF